MSSSLNESSILDMNTLSQIMINQGGKHNQYKKEAQLLKELYPYHDFVTILHKTTREEKLLVDHNVTLQDLLIKYKNYKFKVIHKSKELDVPRHAYIHNLFERYNKNGILYIVINKPETILSRIHKYLSQFFQK